MKYVLIAALMLLLAACEVEDDAAHARFGLQLDPVEGGTIRMRIYHAPGFDGVVQEVSAHVADYWAAPFGPTDLQLVEGWRSNGGYSIDVHTIEPGDYRTMTIYPADFVDTVEDQYGYFQMVASGGFVSAPYVNNLHTGHFATYGMHGTVTRAGEPITWSIDARGGILVIEVDGVVVHSSRF